MTPHERERLALSLIVEPGDAKVVEAVHDRGPGAVLRLQSAQELDRRIDDALARAAQAGLRWVCPGGSEWPDLLDGLDHVEPLNGTVGAPWGLWVRGAARLGDLASRGVAIVGARSCSSYGADVAGEIAADVADAGFTVVSGAAYGIDACAHRGALALRRPTVAVLACGADRAYPVAHTQLLERIVEDGGLVVSEQPPGAEPLRHRFLSRNRLIAALSHGTLVVEAAHRSGSLNTLNWADRLGRTTLAVPGPVTSRRSDGSHAAIRDGRAVLVTSGAQVMQELRSVGVVTREGDGAVR